MNNKQIISLLLVLMFFQSSISLCAETAESNDLVIKVIADSENENMRAGLQAWTDQKEIEKLSRVIVDEEYVKTLYQEFKRTLIDPPNPDTYVTYGIKNGEKALKNSEILGHKLHNLLMALPEDDFEKYANLIAGMRELLYIDIQHIPLAIRGDKSRDVYWYMIHNNFLRKIEQEYLQLFK
jgi:hypothetical protein